MNRREWELLDKQLWGVHPHSPATGAVLSFAFVAVFLVGLLLGGLLFARQSNQLQAKSDQQMIALFHANGSPPMTP